jgi:thioredoxin-like negative regulator of GroEL
VEDVPQLLGELELGGDPLADGTVIAGFGARWCAPWMLLESARDALAAACHRAGIRYIEIDVDARGDLAASWQVVVLPTFLAVGNGQEHERLVGALDRSELLELVTRA